MGFIPHILSWTWSVLTQYVKELILRKFCCPGREKYLQQRARSERVSRGGEEGQEQEADLHGDPPSSGGGDKRDLRTRPRAAGSEGSVWSYSEINNHQAQNKTKTGKKAYVWRNTPKIIIIIK